MTLQAGSPHLRALLTRDTGCRTTAESSQAACTRCGPTWCPPHQSTHSSRNKQQLLAAFQTFHKPDGYLGRTWLPRKGEQHVGKALGCEIQMPRHGPVTCQRSWSKSVAGGGGVPPKGCPAPCSLPAWQPLLVSEGRATGRVQVWVCWDLCMGEERVKEFCSTIR